MLRYKKNKNKNKKSHEKVMINRVRIAQNKGDKSAAAAEKKLLVGLQLQESRAPESSMSTEVKL